MKALDPAQATKWVLAIAAVLGLCTLPTGLMGDDHVHRALLHGFEWFQKGPWDLYVFAPGDAARLQPAIEHGPYPWWTFEGLRVHFFRPISSLLIWFDWAVLKQVWLAHLHAVAWGLALVAVAAALLRRVLPARAAAVASLLFAVDDAHFLPVAWLCNRHALISAVFALGGLWAHLRWREDRKLWGLPLSVAGLAAGLGASESALSVFGFVAAYEALARKDALRTRLLALVPIALLGAGYLAFYGASGYGAYGSAIYVDPGAQPLAFLSTAPSRFLALAGSLTVGIPADLFLAHPDAKVLLAVAGVFGATLWAWALRALWPAVHPEARRAVPWLLLATALSMVPALATFPGDRLLIVSSLGGVAVLGLAVDAALTRAGRWKALVAAVCVAHVAVPVLVWVGQPWVLRRIDHMLERASLQTEVSDAQLDGRVMYLAAPDFLSGIYLPIYRLNAGHPRPKSWNLLSCAPLAHRLTRTGERSFELEPVGGAMLATTWERLFRDPERMPFHPGDRVRLDGAQLTVVALDGVLPTRLRVDLEDAPEAWTFVHWKDERVRVLALPPVGESVLLASEPGPLELAFGFGSKN